MTFKLIKDIKSPVNEEFNTNPNVIVQGVGQYRLDSLEKNVRAKLADLHQRATTAKDWIEWKNIQWMINHGAMREMVKTIVNTKAQIEGKADRMSESYDNGNPGEINIDGYTLRQEEEHEDDNTKIWHIAQAPGEKEVSLEHTPYEYLSQEDFAHYVEHHKKYGQWPDRRTIHNGTANWDRDTLKQMNRRLAPTHFSKAHIMKDFV